MDQLLGQQHAAGLGDRDRRGAQVLAEQAPQLALADAEALGQGVDVGLVECAGLDQAQRAGDGVRGAAPGGEIGRGFGTAAQARPVAGFLGAGGREVEGDVLGFRRAGRADRTAIDAGGLDAYEQASVEPGVAGGDGAVAGVGVHIHAVDIDPRGPIVSRFSDGMVRASGAQSSM